MALAGKEESALWHGLMKAALFAPPVNFDVATRNTTILTDPDSSVRTGYDRWAAVYDHDANPLQALEGPRIRATIGNANGLATLDLGCGTGRHALWLAECGATVTAMDISEKAA